MQTAGSAGKVDAAKNYGMVHSGKDGLLFLSSQESEASTQLTH